MHGIGDALYQRPIIRMLAAGPLNQVYVQTPWPQLYDDLEVGCVMPAQITTVSALRNSVRSYPWSEPPVNARTVRLTYVKEEGSIIQALARGAGFELQRPVDFSGPEVAPEFTRRGTPYILVRPVTLRTEWSSSSRNPKASYIHYAIEKLRKHFHIVSVADVYSGVEDIVRPTPFADETYHKGELSVEALMRLTASAAGVVGGVGWLAPAAAAYRVPMLLVYGGGGALDNPERLFGKFIDDSTIQHVLPDRFCMCDIRAHDCAKTISRFGEHVERFIAKLTSSTPTVVDP